MKKVVWIASLLMLATTGMAQAAGDAAAGKVKSAVCAACHGADGNSGANPLWPKLAGQHRDMLQGYYVSRPLTKEQLLKWVASRAA